jgi:hypothetical protein
MANEFTVEFWGLCGYLLHGKDRNATVMLVEHHHHPHAPKLTVDFASLTNESDEARFPNNNGFVGWMDLAGYDVSVKPGGANSKPDKLDAKNAVGKKKDCPKSDKQDLAWLADLNRLSGGSASRTDILTDPSPPRDVLSRFHLTEGSLWSLDHAADNAVIHKYQFGTDDPAALASASLYTVSASTPIAILRFERGGTFQFEVSFNLPTKALVTHVDPHNTGTLAQHFDALYNLLVGGNRPAPVDTGPCSGSKIVPPNPPRRPCPQAMLRLA